MTGKRTHVVVIGGGYAGTLAANHLRLRPDVDITLVNPRPKFVERIRLHQFVAGNTTRQPTTAPLLGEGIQLVVDSASKIDTATRTVQFASGRKALPYDYVIYAVGSTGAVPASVPGAAAIRLSHSRIGVRAGAAGHARRTASRRAGDRRRRGLTGIETASELAEQGRKVTLVCGGQLAPSMSEGGRRSTAKWMRKHGVDGAGDDVVAEVRKDAVVFADGAVRPSAVTIWTAGFGVPRTGCAPADCAPTPSAGCSPTRR